jgi:hypothetical protein
MHPRVAARARLGRERLPAAGPSDALLGNWYVTLQHLVDGNAFVYMSERTQLSFRRWCSDRSPC